MELDYHPQPLSWSKNNFEVDEKLQGSSVFDAADVIKVLEPQKI